MGLNFDEVQFPASISQGAVGGMRFSTTIIGCRQAPSTATSTGARAGESGTSSMA
jgi:hypothetical protein